ncbi:MAG: hypothetical protein ACFFFK_02870 [Candidatus Thorarchaeota archaeon]
MTEEKIIDYGRQKNVNRVFSLIAVLFAIISIVLHFTLAPTDINSLIIFIGLPTSLFLVSLGMGAGSKRAIDYIPGKWEERKVWVSFTDFDKMVDEYEDAYGELYSHPGDSCTCCVSLIFILILGGLVLFSQRLSIVLIDSLLDPIIFIILECSIFAVVGFVIGFRIPSIDAQEFFKPPTKGDVYNFARELAGVPGIRAGMNVELGVRAGVQTIIGSEVKAYVQNLPETVQIQVQVSHSGFAYPYLVGTAYKGGRIQEHEDTRRIATRYPARLEYSMDEDVMVIVARFDIPKRTSSVPNISTRDFRALAALLAGELEDNYNPE